MAAKIAEEVHLEMFLANKARGTANPTECNGYLQKTAARMIEAHPEGSDARARLQAYFSNDQAIRNLVNNTLKMKVTGRLALTFVLDAHLWRPCSSSDYFAVFKHVLEYEKEKAAAATEAAAAQLAADRLGDLNAPLPIAGAEEVVNWMERFLEDHIEITRGLARFKAPTRELKNASRTIMSRAQEWETRHSSISEKINAFCNHLTSCIKLAFNV